MAECNAMLQMKVFRASYDAHHGRDEGQRGALSSEPEQRFSLKAGGRIATA